jgi:hypothetical protein
VNENIGPLRIGALVFDGTTTATVDFIAILETTNAGNPAFVALYDVTGAALIAASTLTSTSLVPEEQSVTLTIPGDLPAANRVYEVWLWIGVMGQNEQARCLGAFMQP